jgi:hypothetical protein
MISRVASIISRRNNASLGYSLMTGSKSIAFRNNVIASTHRTFFQATSVSMMPVKIVEVRNLLWMQKYLDSDM